MESFAFTKWAKALNCRHKKMADIANLTTFKLLRVFFGVLVDNESRERYAGSWRRREEKMGKLVETLSGDTRCSSRRTIQLYRVN